MCQFSEVSNIDNEGLFKRSVDAGFQIPLMLSIVCRGANICFCGVRGTLAARLMTDAMLGPHLCDLRATWDVVLRSRDVLE